MKSKLIIFNLILSFFILTTPCLAKKKLHSNKSILSNKYDVQIIPKLRSDNKALLLIFKGMDKAEKVDYTLIYDSGPVPQGIESSHNPKDGNAQKELIFGVCSGSDCTYHGNISNMILTIISKLTSGKTLTQRYKINP